MKALKLKIIAGLLSRIIANLDGEDIKKLIDSIMDRIEEKHKPGSIVFELVQFLREVMSIPDND